MIGITIRGKRYQVCSEWEDITLGKFIELSQIEIPAKLERLWLASSQLRSSYGDKTEEKKAEEEYKKANEDITEADSVKVFPEYYGKVIEHLTTIPPDIVALLHTDLRVDLFDNYLRFYVLSLLYSAPLIMREGEARLYEPKEVESFTFGGHTYYLPKSLRLYGDVIPMADEEVAPFAEAADIDLAVRELRRDGVVRFPLFMAIYCRKKDEEYSEKIALEREQLFRGVDMSIVWTLFFCIVRLIATLQRSTLRYLMTHRQKIGAAI